ncbi:MAG: energy transducer TonB [Terricaulis sp.]
MIWSLPGAAQPPSPPFATPAAGAYEPSIVYDAPPPSLLLPQLYSIEGIRAAVGNLARWRDQERARVGPYEAQWRNERQVVRNALPPIGGYYAFFGNADFPAGIVEARWEDARSEIGRPSTVRGAYVAPRNVCGGVVARMRGSLAAFAYLGSSWREEFSALEVELAALTPMPEGPQIGAGVPIVPNSLPNSSRFYPQRALEREIEGQVMLGCFVRPDLSLQCGVVSETPPGWGFGEAAQEIFSRVRGEPQARNGEPSAGACAPYAVPFRLM